MKRNYLLLLVFSITVPLFSQQAGWWTWMKGSSTPGGAGTYGTMGVPAPGNTPPSLYQCAASWTDSQGNLWQLGGGNANYSSALFKYTPSTNMWTWIHGPTTLGNGGVWGTKGVAAPGNIPSSRGMGIACWVDAQDNLWLFGGNGLGSTGTIKGWLSDLWKYDPVTNMWTWMHGPSTINQPGVYGTQGVPSPANVPTPRYECNATWVDNNGKFWMFGGGSPMGTLNDLWKYDPATNQWTWMKGSSTAGNAGSYGTKGVAAATNNPPARWAYCRWKDNTGNFWLFGGTHQSNTQSMNDMWKFDPATNNWTWMSGSNLKDQLPPLPTPCVPSTTNYPQARYENPIAWKDLCGNLWMFGGHWAPGLSVPDINDIWCYKVQTNEWVFVGGNFAAANGVPGTQGVPAAGNIPASHYSSAAWSYNNVFWFFGGRAGTGGSDVNTLWRYYPDTTCAGSTCSIASPIAGFNGTNLSGCAPLTVTFTNTSTNATTWTWNFGDGGTSTAQNPVHTYTAAGTYTVTQIAYNGPNSDTLIQPNYVTVGQSPTLSLLSQTNVLCFGGSTGSASVSASGSSAPYTYSWNNGSTTSTLSGLAAGTYSAVVTDATGCSSTQTVTISQPPALNISVSNTPASCNSSDGTAAAAANGGTSPLSYLWSNGATTAGISGLAAGNYSVTVTDANGCTQASVTAVTNSNGPTATAGTSVSILAGNAVTLSSGGGITYSWSPATGLNNSTLSNPTASPSSTTQYCVYVFDTSGCYDSACVTVYVIPEPTVCGEFYLPNAFSPNQDGENELFQAYVNPACVTEFRIVIYNRWGEKLYESSDINDGWNGDHRNSPSNPGVYAYYCRATFTNGKKISKKGNVSLVR